MPQQLGIDDVSVVGDKNLAKRAVSGDGLSVGECGTAGCGVTGVADGQAAGDDVQRLLIEDTINETEPTIEVEFLVIVRGGDAGAFLAAMLE